MPQFTPSPDYTPEALALGNGQRVVVSLNAVRPRGQSDADYVRLVTSAATTFGRILQRLSITAR